MAKRKYSEVEMIGALKQMEAGRSAAEVGAARGFCAAAGDGVGPGVGAGFRARCGGEWEEISGAERD
jgi:hypothetical protein